MCPAPLTFEEAERALAAFQSRGWRLGLDRMNAFVDELGLREYVTGSDRPRYFHVAGTNGKGSTTCFLQNLLHEHGYRVGACYSPYVYDVRERVQIGLDMISKEEFAACTELLLAAGEKLERTEFGGPTEFEMKIAMGFLAWKRAGVDAVALETGMGGRLDATNVVEPACSIITSISLDHVEHLGSTYTSIAREKAGIIKPGRPVVVGRLPGEALVEVRAVARQMRSACLVADEDFEVTHEGVGLDGLRFGFPAMKLQGSIQRVNAGLALAALRAAGLEVDLVGASRALAQASLPGRMERRQVGSRWAIFDGAHNEEAAGVLAQTLREEYPGQRFTLVWGMLRGHEPGAFLRALKDVVAEVVPVEVKVEHRESYTVEELAHVCQEVGISCAQGEAGYPLLVTGSFYLSDEFLRAGP